MATICFDLFYFIKDGGKKNLDGQSKKKEHMVQTN
jgi:hypothetical protein